MQILSGRITCGMQTSYTDMFTSGGVTARTIYNDQQVLSWTWSNSPALLVGNVNQPFNVQFRAQGNGSKLGHEESTNSTGHHTQDTNGSWTMNCGAPVPLFVRQVGGGTALASPETNPANGYALTETLYVDNIQQGPPTITSGPAIALAVSINWNLGSLEDLLNRLDPIGVASPPPPPSSRLLSVRLNRPGAPVIRGTRQDILTARGPDAPLGKYKTTANWSWEITTQP
jgi:hypothetical protein